MNLKINDENHLFDSSTSLNISEVLNTLEIKAIGIAIAVNNKIISHSEWENYTLEDGDSLTIIKAACGG